MQIMYSRGIRNPLVIHGIRNPSSTESTAGNPNPKPFGFPSDRAKNITILKLFDRVHTLHSKKIGKIESTISLFIYNKYE